jgi:hypothetical protein
LFWIAVSETVYVAVVDALQQLGDREAVAQCNGPHCFGDFGSWYQDKRDTGPRSLPVGWTGRRCR